jgi:hypothetical protein
MKQLRLFPAPGTLTQPWPDDVQTQARQLLAELLAAVLETATEQSTSREGESHEQDPENPS